MRLEHHPSQRALIATRPPLSDGLSVAANRAKGRPVLELLKDHYRLHRGCCGSLRCLLVAYGLGVAHWHTLRGERREVWLRFGVWLLLGLKFQLAAEVVRTAVSQTWRESGQLAAIQTFLSFFLQRDLDDSEHRRKAEGKPIRSIAA